MAHDVFVSHSEKDKAVADAVVARLEAESVTCWTAPREVVPGADWGESIINAIESSRIMILIFSESANASPQVRREVERAVNKGVYFIPFRVHGRRGMVSRPQQTPQWCNVARGAHGNFNTGPDDADCGHIAHRCQHDQRWRSAELRD